MFCLEKNLSLCRFVACQSEWILGPIFDYSQHHDQNEKALREMQTLCAGFSKVQPKTSGAWEAKI